MSTFSLQKTTLFLSSLLLGALLLGAAPADSEEAEAAWAGGESFGRAVMDAAGILGGSRLERPAPSIPSMT